ncbi:hypothetical protein E4U56_007482 [Claviceps arundinis]|uniref:Microbial-type PARG catalytic domain-containing protein n=1 Tax=Claviceps arundinis TaxID=1623583 RepID=A0A9P7MWE4_9HYPO|nr:hypothetical protein E4U56_007482 [Claviceps arundinis]
MNGGNTLPQVVEVTENLSYPVVLSHPISYAGNALILLSRSPVEPPRSAAEPVESPEFRVVTGDPVQVALDCATDNGGIRVPFICAANRDYPGLRHQDQRPTYEEDFCDRSNLRDTLTRTKTSKLDNKPLYPINATGGIFSDKIAVYLGPRDKYEKLNPIPNLPVVSVPPVRRPPVNGDGTEYILEEDLLDMIAKIRGALLMCLAHLCNRIVVGDFGLGDGYYNPPQAVAEIWRDLFLFDTDIRGLFKSVDFVFLDPMQSTTQWLQDERQKHNEREWMNNLARDGISLTNNWEEPPSSRPAPTDMAIFQSVFDKKEIERLTQKALRANQ